MSVRILNGDCRSVLKALPDESIHCCVTSPPYFGLRDYGVDGQIGLEPTPDAFVAEMVDVFREVRRVLRADGTLWLNLGDSYASAGSGAAGDLVGADGYARANREQRRRAGVPSGLKPKDRMMVPARVAIALQADGWWLRDEIVWAKPSPMPAPIKDRTTCAHEMIYMLAKSSRYFYDFEAIKEPSVSDHPSGNGYDREERVSIGGRGQTKGWTDLGGTRIKRSVWTVGPQPFSEAHFATFPPDLIEPCIKAGCPDGGTVLDPFGGAGTTGLVADRLGRDALLIELNPEYADMAERRIHGDAPLFAQVAAE